MIDTRRYTGTWYEDGHTDCSAGRQDCQYEYENQICFHCGTKVREHVNEDGTYVLVEPTP